jgi:hypothetical protein
MAENEAMAGDGAPVGSDATSGHGATVGDGEKATVDGREAAVELLYWSGCPSHPRALADLREAMALEGLDPDAIAVREVDSEEQAERERFVGSPTIRIDGRDVRPPGPDEPYGLTCRVYRRRDGRISPTPDREDVRDALRMARAAPGSPGEAS